MKNSGSLIPILVFLLTTIGLSSQNISNITVSQRQDGSGKVDVNYTLAGSADAYNISAEVSLNNGATWQSITNLSGNVNNVSPGNRQVVWNAGAEMPGEYANNARIKLMATESGGAGQPCPGMPTFTYGGQTYNTVQIGTQCWMKENLNYFSNNSWCFDNDQNNCNTYGRLYNWQTAHLVCPTGWHLPNENNWCALAQNLDPNVDCNIWGLSGTDAAGKMKEIGMIHWNTPNIGATNLSGFTALGAGWRDWNGDFYNLKGVDYFWSSSQDSDINGITWGVTAGDAKIRRDNTYKSRFFSVRCIKD